MSDDYTIHIKASVDGGDDGGNNGPTDAQQEAQSNASLIEELLKTTSYSTEPSEPAQKRGPGRPKKDKSNEIPKDEADPKRAKTAVEEMLEKLKSFVAIFDGHNGRFTKILNGISRTVTGWQNTVHAASTAASKTAQATATAGQAAQTAAAAQAATGATASSFGATIASVAAKMGPAGIAAAALAVAVVGTIAAIKAVNHALESMKEMVGSFSATLEMAKANEQVAIIQRKMQSAGQIGGEVAAIQSGQTEINNTINKIWTNFYDLIYPYLKVFQSVALQILKVVNSYLELLVAIHDFAESAVEKFLEVMSHLPVVGKIYKIMLDWMQQDNIKEAEKSTLNARIEGIFTSPMERDKNNKQRVESRFL